MTLAPPVIDVRLVAGPAAWLPIEPFPQDCGGECVFLGRTRRETHPAHGVLRLLRYEAHEAMAMAVLKGLAGQAVDRFQCSAVRVHHSLGDVPPGEASVLVQAACAHRAAAFEACRFLIDELKKQAPIWKQEQWEQGATWPPGHLVAAGVEGAARRAVE